MSVFFDMAKFADFQRKNAYINKSKIQRLRSSH